MAEISPLFQNNKTSVNNPLLNMGNTSRGISPLFQEKGKADEDDVNPIFGKTEGSDQPNRYGVSGVVRTTSTDEVVQEKKEEETSVVVEPQQEEESIEIPVQEPVETEEITGTLSGLKKAVVLGTKELLGLDTEEDEKTYAV